MNDSQTRIQNLIVHKVDHKNYDEPLLSDLPSPYSAEVASFLRRHIKNNREHKNSRTAIFCSDVDAKGPRLKKMVDTILDDPNQFVPESRKIAKHLYDSLDERTSPGDLVICTYSEGDHSEGPWLALLKMDPSDGFAGERQEVDGKWQVVLQRVPNVLPTGNLQKCAFILPIEMREERKHDLIVLDQQAARYATRRPVASFFSGRFLQCDVNLNREDMTVLFVAGSRKWLARREADWPAGDVIQFNTQLYTTLQNQTIDAAAFAAAVISDAEEQDDYLAYIKNYGLDQLVFQPDPKRRAKLTTYANFEGDNGLRVRIKANAVGPGQTLRYHRDKATNEWVVEIRTTVWRRK